MRKSVGPYRILEILGQGGMGVVYRGIHDHLGRQVAVKALPPEMTRQPQFRERFFSEARTQAKLQHPNIVTIYDLIEEEGEFFIVMEYVEGRELDELLHESRGVGLEVEPAVSIFIQILLALDHAHSQGVIHRDVKSSNVLVDDRGQVKLMDFGIALLVGNKRLTQSSQSIGTPVYMSPEQILRPREVDHRTDIYSAGVLFYEMLSGQPPFDAETEYEIKKQHIEATAPDLSSITAEISTELASVIAKSLAKDPDERHASAGEFLRALRHATTDQDAIETPVERPSMSRLTSTGGKSTIPTPAPAPLGAPPLLPGPPPPLPANGAINDWLRSWLPTLSKTALALSLLIAGGLLFSSLGSDSPKPLPVSENGVEEELSGSKGEDAMLEGAPTDSLLTGLEDADNLQAETGPLLDSVDGKPSPSSSATPSSSTAPPPPPKRSAPPPPTPRRRSPPPPKPPPPKPPPTPPEQQPEPKVIRAEAKSQAPPAKVITLRGVTLYEDEDFQGDSIVLTHDVPSLGKTPFGNNSASSLKVDPGCNAILYRNDNYGGKHEVFSSNARTLRRTAVRNDRASSLKVICPQ